MGEINEIEEHVVTCNIRKEGEFFHGVTKDADGLQVSVWQKAHATLEFVIRIYRRLTP